MFRKKIYIFFLFLIVTVVIFITLRPTIINTAIDHNQAPIASSPPAEEQPLNSTSEDYERQEETGTSGIESDSDQIDQIDQIINTLTVDEKIGQLFIFGFEGKQFSDAKQLQLWIEKHHIGNFIVFKRNIESNKQLESLISELDEYNKASHIPIWVGIDQEGGVVNRLPNKYPSAMQFADWNDPSLTYNKHDEMANELTELGIDINFGPVLDINSNPNNPVINSRAFGNDANTVVKHTEAVINSYNDNNMFAVGKHYPGHGDTNDDSHLKLPVVNKTWDELLELELLPFIHAIEQQISSIMVGHLLINTVDEKYPASLSSILVNEKLIEELGFNGIVITDDLVMDGILDHFSIGEAAVLALEAGAHMLIIGHNEALQLEAIEAVKEAVKSGRISDDDLNKKLYKLFSYKLNVKE